MKKNIIFAAVCILLIILLYSLSVKQFAPVPDDDNHTGITQEADCLLCHEDEGEYPRKKDHPPKDQCFKCHERKAE